MAAGDYEQLTVECGNGRLVGVDCAARHGDLAVTRRLEGEGWTITYAPSGFSVPYRFHSPAAAGVAMEEISAIANFSQLVLEMAEGRRPEVIAKISFLCRRAGGVYVDPATAWQGDDDWQEGHDAELRRRLAD